MALLLGKFHNICTLKLVLLLHRRVECVGFLQPQLIREGAGTHQHQGPRLRGHCGDGWHSRQSMCVCRRALLVPSSRLNSGHPPSRRGDFRNIDALPSLNTRVQCAPPFLEKELVGLLALVCGLVWPRAANLGHQPFSLMSGTPSDCWHRLQWPALSAAPAPSLGQQWNCKGQHCRAATTTSGHATHGCRLGRLGGCPVHFVVRVLAHVD